MPNAWNIQTFTISLLWFDQFWWNFAWHSIFAFPSWWVSKSLRILKSKLADGGQLENWKKNSISFITLPQRAKKSANNRFHAKLVKFSNFYDMFAVVWPILMKFSITTHISYLEYNSSSKSQIKKKIKIFDLKNCEMQYLSNWFTHLDKICCHDAY